MCNRRRIDRVLNYYESYWFLCFLLLYLINIVVVVCCFILNHSQENSRGGYIALLLASGPGAVHTMGMPTKYHFDKEVETEEDKFERAEMVSFHTIILMLNHGEDY